LIRDTVQTLLPLRRAIAAKHQVGMAVNQARRDQTTLKIDTVRCPEGMSDSGITARIV
jgi:hypothetical protein